MLILQCVYNEFCSYSLSISVRLYVYNGTRKANTNNGINMGRLLDSDKEN